MYEAMLREQFILAIQETARRNLDDIYSQPDGVSPHYGVNVHQYLDEIFSDRWIGRTDTLNGQLDLQTLIYLTTSFKDI